MRILLTLALAAATVGAAEDKIQWFATWKSGLAEAQRTGKPILLVSAAPHCRQVSGLW